MKVLINMIMISVSSMLLSSCGNFSSITGCPDGEIEWVDMVMINDIKYQYLPKPADVNNPLPIEKGRELGKVTFKMADRACSNHKMKNGDAAYLEEGTSIYEIKGYPTSLIVVANDKAFLVDTNIKAKTADNLFPLDGWVKNIYIESTEDGSRIQPYKQDSTKKFLDDWSQLKLEDPESLYKKGKMEGDRIFLEIELNNGVSFRLVYWVNSNIFSNGVIGSKEIKNIIEDELSHKISE
ncbi:hypothetical protein ACFPYN_17310 [Paenisporosarcina macmurdoensis]|uniref:DUF4367 domain-containing protein n=1 Tax=Paenisporosarcina macmurdoensis TaxID=212659 RepID=A0ABW1LCH9_9BACL